MGFVVRGLVVTLPRASSSVACTVWPCSTYSAALWSGTSITAHEEVFRGTLTQTSVYPRELVKSALARNAAAIAVAHNHPSGQAEPSRADEFLTQTLKSALALVDIRLIDHFVVAGDQCVSFAERGLL